jgi:hypothetical protein
MSARPTIPFCIREFFKSSTECSLSGKALDRVVSAHTLLVRDLIAEQSGQLQTSVARLTSMHATLRGSDAQTIKGLITTLSEAEMISTELADRLLRRALEMIESPLPVSFSPNYRPRKPAVHLQIRFITVAARPHETEAYAAVMFLDL